MVTHAPRLAKRGGAGRHRPFGFSGWHRQRLRVVAIGAAVSVLLAITSCAAPDTATSDRDVRATVLRYNRLLAEGYRILDMSALREVATELQAETEYIHMSAVGEGGVRLLPRLVSAEFVDVSIEGTAALVVTRETWDYAHESNPGRDVRLVQQGLVYDLAWDLTQADDGLWYVSDIRSVSATSAAEPQRFDVPEGGSK